MKKLFLFSIVGLFFGASATPKAEAQNYVSRVISVCPVCHQHVYAYYRPVNYGGVIRYTWIPAYHSRCAAHSAAIRYVPQSHQGISYRYVVPNYGYHHHHHSCSSRYSGYLTPGFTIRITR